MDKIKELAVFLAKEFHDSENPPCGICSDMAERIIAAGYRKPAPSEKLVEKIATAITKYLMRQGIMIDIPYDLARSLASLLPEMKLIGDEKIKLLVSQYELQGLNCEQLIRIGAEAQLAADRKE